MPRLRKIEFLEHGGGVERIRVTTAEGAERELTLRAPTGTFPPSCLVFRAYYEALMGQIVEALQ